MFGVNPEPVDAVQVGGWAPIRAAYVLRSVGGLSCGWSDDGEVGAAGGSWLLVEAIPDAAEEWAHPWHVPGEPVCNEYACTGEVLTEDEAWVAVRTGVVGVDTATFATMVERIAGTLSSAGGSEFTVAEQTLAETCDGVADIEAIREALGTATPLGFSGGGGGWSIVSAAQSLAGLPGIPSCGISAQADPMAGYGSIDWLPSGAWAFEESGTQDRDPIELLGARDNAGYLACDASETACTVSFMLDESWVIASANELALPYPDPTLQPATLSVRDAAVAIAELVAA
jgi:hypothetical protein